MTRPDGTHRTGDGCVEPGDERAGLEPDQDVARSVDRRPNLEIVRVEQLSHVEPAQRLIPGKPEVAPRGQSIAVQGERLGLQSIERRDAGPDGEPIRLDRGSVEPRGLHRREIGPGRSQVGRPEGRAPGSRER